MYSTSKEHIDNFGRTTNIKPISEKEYLDYYNNNNGFNSDNNDLHWIAYCESIVYISPGRILT